MNNAHLRKQPRHRVSLSISTTHPLSRKGIEDSILAAIEQYSSRGPGRSEDSEELDHLLHGEVKEIKFHAT
jgi:hypothetical protein